MYVFLQHVLNESSLYKLCDILGVNTHFLQNLRTFSKLSKLSESDKLPYKCFGNMGRNMFFIKEHNYM